jgi:hypothetical protein
MKVGDLVKHKILGSKARKACTGIVTEISRNGPPGFPVHVTALWLEPWLNGRSIEQQYLEVLSESR